jgi:hypothetical protein
MWSSYQPKSCTLSRPFAYYQGISLPLKSRYRALFSASRDDSHRKRRRHRSRPPTAPHRRGGWRHMLRHGLSFRAVARLQSAPRIPAEALAQLLSETSRLLTVGEVAPFFSSLSPLPRAFGGQLLEGRLLYRPTSGQVRPRRRSCRASSTTCTAGSGGNLLANPPRSPDGRAV